MALNEDVYPGRLLSLTAGGSISRWETYEITDTWNTSDASGADSESDEVCITNGLTTGTVTGFITDLANPGTLPQKGDLLTDFAVEAGGDSVIPDMTRHGNIRVTEFKTNGSKDPAKWSMSFRSGVLGTPPA